MQVREVAVAGVAEQGGGARGDDQVPDGRLPRQQPDRRAQSAVGRADPEPGLHGVAEDRRVRVQPQVEDVRGHQPGQPTARRGLPHPQLAGQPGRRHPGVAVEQGDQAAVEFVHGQRRPRAAPGHDEPARPRRLVVVRGPVRGGEQQPHHHAGVDVHDPVHAADHRVDQGQQRLVVGGVELREHLQRAGGHLHRPGLGAAGEGQRGLVDPAGSAAHGELGGDALAQVLGNQGRREADVAGGRHAFQAARDGPLVHPGGGRDLGEPGTGVAVQHAEHGVVDLVEHRQGCGGCRGARRVGCHRASGPVRAGPVGVWSGAGHAPVPGARIGARADRGARPATVRHASWATAGVSEVRPPAPAGAGIRRRRATECRVHPIMGPPLARATARTGHCGADGARPGPTTGARRPAPSFLPRPPGRPPNRWYV